MINLLNIQETSRTGTPPAPEQDKLNEPVSGRKFSEYLEESNGSLQAEAEAADRLDSQAAVDQHRANSRSSEKTSKQDSENRSLTSDQTEKGSESEKSVFSEKGNGGISSKDGKKRAEGRSEASIAGSKDGLKIDSERFDAAGRKFTVATEAESILSKDSKAPEKPASIKNENKKVLRLLREVNPKAFSGTVGSGEEKISSNGEMSDLALEAEELVTDETGIAGNQNRKAGVSGEDLLGELRSRGRSGDTKQNIGTEGEGVRDSGKLAAGLKKGADASLKIELSDQRKVIKKGSGKNTSVKPFSSVLNAAGESSSTSEQAVTGLTAGSESREAGNENSNTGFRVMELGASVEREGNVETLSMNKGELAGSFKSLLKDEGVPNIVKQTGILLKDNKAGEIRLILKPESLGKVRIRLNLNENNIAGRIYVENINVKDAFNATMEDLQRALREAGFDSANLEVFVQGDGAGESHGNKREDQPVMVHPSVIESIEENIPLAESLSGEASVRVNLLA
ncbi:MAG: flagellar hook-length control protein FliK [Spirochaetales bacterium]|nr:flagellar hook-length control protein FliK [Spirochaetales bacterium]